MKVKSTLLALFVFLAIQFGCKNSNPTTPPPGPDWVVFTQANSPLLADRIYCLVMDGSGAIWLGTDSGASTYLAGSWSAIRDSLAYTVYSSGGSVTAWKVSAMAGAKSNILWFGLDGGGARRYNRFSLSAVWLDFNPPDISGYNVTAIAADRFVRGDVFVCSAFGVSHYTPSQNNPDAGVWQDVPSGNLPSSNVRAAAVNPTNNSFCFGTFNGAAFFDGVSVWSIYNFPPAYNYPITSVAFDLSNTVWLGKLVGVSSVDLNNVSNQHHYTSQNTNGQLPGGPVNAVVTDLHTTRWFGTNSGLVRLQDTTWTTFTAGSTPLPSDTVTALLYDSRGNLWVGTARGVAVYNSTGTRF